MKGKQSKWNDRQKKVVLTVIKKKTKTEITTEWFE